MINFVTDNNIEYNFTDSEQMLRDNSANAIANFIDWTSPQIEQVGIELNNFCNGICGFCPANKKVDIRKHEVMSQGVLDKVIHDLKSIDYKGGFCLSINNEPLLKSDFIMDIKKIRSFFPKNRIAFYTNGTLLTKDFLLQAIELVDEITIDQYDYSGHQKLNKNIKEIINQNFTLLSKSKCNVFLFVQNPNLVKLNRGGALSEYKKPPPSF